MVSLQGNVLDTFTNFGRSAILQHLHAKNVAELSIPSVTVRPVPPSDPLVGTLVGGSLAVLDATGIPLIIINGKR